MIEIAGFIKVSLLVGGILFVPSVSSQELYVFTEPASNMPAGSLGAKVSGKFGEETMSGKFAQRYTPELMLGINRKWMLHATTSFSDMYSPQLRWESLRLYGKYRFLSNDDVHRHFRMAAFGSLVYSRNELLFDELSDMGDQSAFSAGVVATQLINKLALSSSVAYNGYLGERSKTHHHHPYSAINYTVSAGYLILPVEYRNFKQTNLNVYLELLGQKALDMNRYYTDLAPAAQLIFNSSTKLNIGRRFQLGGNMHRMMENSWLISLEHTLFNVFGR